MPHFLESVKFGERRCYDIGVAGADIAQQCLNMGALDEIRVDLVPVFFSEGAHCFDNIENDKIQLELLQIVEGK